MFLDFDKLSHACFALENGAVLYATHIDIYWFSIILVREMDDD